jgi:hypothetical protein
MFDSWVDDVLFFSQEITLVAASYSNRQYVVTYPQYAGKKLAAFFMLCNYTTLDAMLIPSCRVTYPSGVPTVTVFMDSTRTDMSIAPGILTVMYSGALQ